MQERRHSVGVLDPLLQQSQPAHAAFDLQIRMSCQLDLVE